MGEDGGLPAEYGERLAALGAGTLGAMQAMETVQRRLHPPAIDELRAALSRVEERLGGVLEAFREADCPETLRAFHEDFAAAAALEHDAVRTFAESGSASGAVARVLGAFRLHCRALEALYPLRRVMPPFGRFFLEPDCRERVEELDPEPTEGVSVGFHTSDAEDRDQRGGLVVYVPESYDGVEPWPLVVALHGGSGNGRDFVWTWLREAKSRRALILSPTSQDGTWSLMGPDHDLGPLSRMVDFVGEHWNLDRSRVLVTGLSDGGTYSLLCGLAEGSPFTHIAPVSGVLHPLNLANGNIERARGRPIYLVHGTLDWMFPVALARAAHETLEQAGAEIVFREIADLSHTYPREENARIMDWFLRAE